MIKNLVNENELVQMVWQKLVYLADYHKTGTYNKQDPTHYEKLRANVYIGYADYNVYWDDEANCEYPDETILEVEAYDCTWGLRFDITIQSKPEITAAGYWGRECFSKDIPDRGEWHGVSSPMFFEMMKDILFGTELPGPFEDMDNYMTNPEANK